MLEGNNHLKIASTSEGMILVVGCNPWLRGQTNACGELPSASRKNN